MFTTSVIIPSYNGVHKILNIIKALEQQTIQDFETIIMIDGSTDNTKEVLQHYKHTLHSLKIVNQENQGRAKVRNDGAKRATGDLLIFFDDDMRPLPSCIKEHTNFHNNNSQSIVVGAQIEELEKCTTDIQKYKYHLSTLWTQPLIDFKGKPLQKHNLHLTAANFSIPKELFFNLQMFDERLNDAEDWDLAVRAYLENLPIYYHHKAFAWHDDFITCKSYIKRQKEYKTFHKKLLALKPELYTKFTKRLTTKPTLIKRIIYSFFKLRIWSWFIDHFNLFMIFPKTLRYRLYSLVIESHVMLN